WGLSVSPSHFAEQLEVIKRYFHPLSMQELLRQFQHGKIPNRSIVVTFDDGYRDNLQNGRPLLEKYGIPATIFLVSDAIGEGRSFWWDELEWLLLQPGTLPEALELDIRGRQYEWQLGEARSYSIEDRQNDRQRRPWDAPPGTRLAFFYLVWQHLLELSKSERLEALDSIRLWAGFSSDREREDCALNREEARALGRGSLVELGAHTVTHAALKQLPGAQQWEEISGSKSQLEDLLGRPVTSFSYPHGEYSAETRELVRRAGFQSATTTDFKCVRRDADPFQLPRFQVDDWSGEEFLRRLTRWYALS
ncbi:MAG: polysaccharide deacetylase family protein, partial [Chloroflexota bacterium]|nr:polysaccharide deacetylase family protein [Chloroflexota bacterium]